MLSARALVAALPLRARLKARLEQAHQLAGDDRVGREGALHVGLAEGRAGLQQVAAVGTQHHHLAGVEFGREQQAVEAVVLDRPAPGRAEGVAEDRLDALDLDDEAVAVLELEVLDPGGAAFGPGELVGTFGDHAQAEVLQHRQHVRDRHRIAELQDLQVQALQHLRGRAVEIEPQRLGLPAECLEVG